MPLPEVDQYPLPVPPITNPLNKTGVLEQAVWSVPAITCGIVTIVKIMLSLIWLQPLLFSDNKVSITEPAVVSSAEGIYVGLRIVSEGEKVPVPLVIQ